jgi:Trypsin-co-occurring domain 2
MAIKLREVVEALKEELSAPQKSKPMFKVSSATVKVSVAIKEATKTHGGVEIVVVKVGSEIQDEATTIHEITVELVPIGTALLGSERDAGPID